MAAAHKNETAPEADTSQPFLFPSPTLIKSGTKIHLKKSAAILTLAEVLVSAISTPSCQAGTLPAIRRRPP